MAIALFFTDTRTEKHISVTVRSPCPGSHTSDPFPTPRPVYPLPTASRLPQLTPPYISLLPMEHATEIFSPRPAAESSGSFYGYCRVFKLLPRRNTLSATFALSLLVVKVRARPGDSYRRSKPVRAGGQTQSSSAHLSHSLYLHCPYATRYTLRICEACEDDKDDFSTDKH